jgi:hypothetical protein
MALHSTTRETNFQRSIKKRFLEIATASSTTVFFENLDDVPIDASGDKLTSWIICLIGIREQDTVLEQLVHVFVFTRNDPEGDDLISLCDQLYEELYDSEDGPKSIDFYDTEPETWVKVGGIVPYVQPFSRVFESENNTRYRSIDILCKWGSK